jgi:hypothetical protein
VLPEMASDRAMGCLRLNGLSIGTHQHRGHQAQRAVALGHYVGLEMGEIEFTGRSVKLEIFVF